MDSQQPIKFSIAGKGNVNKRPPPQVKEETKDFINEISGNKIFSVTPTQTKEGPYVIPLALQGQTKRSKPNSAQNTNSAPNTIPNVKSEPIDVDSISSSNEASKTLDQIAAEALIKDARMETDTEANARSVPLTVQNQIEGLENITDEEERFKYDLESRPDEAGSEEYEDMPIDEFGFAMLRGMGWTPGATIGLNNRGLVEPIEFVQRPGYRLGLGATPKDLPIKKKKFIKPGESRDPPPIMVAAAGPDGKVRHVKSISEKLVPLKRGLQPGQLVGIVSGPHEGLYARIVDATGDGDEIEVRLQASSETLVVSRSDVSIVDLAALSEGHPALKFMIKEKKERDRDQRDEKDSSAYQKKDSSDKKDKSSKSSKDSSSSSSSSSSWIRPRIMVRVVSKSFHNGKYYNKKVSIYDVIGHNECVVQLDNGSLLEGVKQRMLETVIPQAGGKVMVVEGVNKGKVGKLLERSKLGNTEKAIVQMMGDFSIETFSLDDVAQYVGTFDEETVDINV